MPTARARPPIPMRPLDGDAMEAARARGVDEAAVWLAGCAGSADVRARVVRPPASASVAAEPLGVGAIAAAVDAGRDLARTARADGITVLVADGDARGAPELATWLTGRDLGVEDVVARHRPDIRGPLGALRRLGDERLCFLVGVALGAGEHGLALVCASTPALAAAAVAVELEPRLRPRVRAAPDEPAPTRAALLDHLALEPLPGGDVAALLGTSTP
jgi:nicotinate-nucleotide--dimethylbenzimidazole phosphoribosyltransferase